MTATISTSAKRISYQNQSQITDIHTPSSPDASRKEKLTMQSITVHRKLSEDQAGQSLLILSGGTFIPIPISESLSSSRGAQ